MTGIAVLIMLLAIVIIWGGLAVSITALISVSYTHLTLPTILRV